MDVCGHMLSPHFIVQVESIQLLGIFKLCHLRALNLNVNFEVEGTAIMSMQNKN
jgi:hypothetical protein